MRTLVERLLYRFCAYLKIPYTFNTLWHANIEISSHCNLGCEMCGWDASRPNATMDFETFQTVIAELKRHGRPLLALHQYGEPLLHRELGRFIDHAKAQGFPICLYTNATLLDGKRRELIRQHPVDGLRVSFYPERTTYERIWRNARFSKVLDNLQQFLQESQAWSAKPTLSVNLLHERGADLELLKETAIRLLGNWPNLKFEYDEMINLTGSSPELNYMELEPRVVPCVHTYTQVAILQNGDVAPCCNDLNGEVILGNIKKDSLRAIRQGSVIKNLRRRINSGRVDDIPICKHCPMCRGTESLFARDIKTAFRIRLQDPLKAGGASAAPRRSSAQPEAR